MNISGYQWSGGGATCAHEHLMPAFIAELEILVQQRGKPAGQDLKAFDLGCGNGSVAGHLCDLGWSVTGVDPSIQGIEQAKLHHAKSNLHVGSAYDDLQARFGQFPLVYSLEVVEHVYAPRDYAKTLVSLMQDNAVAIVSTPYHGYWKNLAMAVTGKMDDHFTALWDHGHIKFWSVKTLTQLFSEVGLDVVRVHRVGRIPALAKSMILVLRKSQKNTAT